MRNVVPEPGDRCTVAHAESYKGARRPINALIATCSVKTEAALHQPGIRIRSRQEGDRIMAQITNKG